MKSGCWAASLCDCVGKLSGEHIVSESLWTGPTLTVSGGPWGEGKEIGIANITAKILCESHNSRLSEADIAGALAFSSIRAGIAVSNARKLISARPWMPHGYVVDGPKTERWFLKTAINVALLLKREPLWAFDGSQGSPPRKLVEMAFGLRDVPRPLGLYVAGAVGDLIDSREEVRCDLLFDTQQQISAALFLFRGLTFLLNLRDVAVGDIGSTEASKSLTRSREDFLYHLNRLNSDVGGYRSHFLEFVWPGAKFHHFAP